ncbi:cell division protein DrpB [Kosakonia sp. H02]|nr:cell division protein DrpB [Kosakonia sp. H02]
MEDSAARSAGGKLALWVFWIYCLYFCWTVLNDLWLASQAKVPSGFGNGAVNSVGSWLNTISGIVALSAVGAILGAIAWYTRPRDADT